MSAKRARGLTRKITLDHALSYDRTVPNRRGVTALAELNGTGAYGRRYERAKRLLEKGDVKGNPMKYTAKQSAAMKRMSGARRANFKKMLAAAGYRANRGKFRRNQVEGGSVFLGQEQSDFPDFEERGPAPSPGKAKRHGGGRPKKKGKGRLTRKEFIAKREAEAKKKALAAYKAYAKKHPRKVRAVKAGRGRYTGIVAKGLGRPMRTYMYKGKGGVRHIPEYAVMGYKTAASMKKADAGKVADARARLQKRRERAASAATKRILSGQGIFSPNAGEVLSFEEWKKMNENKRGGKKRTKKGRKGHRTAAQKAATKRMLAALKAKRAGRKAPKRHRKAAKKSKRHVAKKHAGKRLTKHQIRVRAGKKAAATRRRHAKKGGHKVTRRKATHRKTTHRKTVRRAAPKRHRKATTHRRRARRMTVKRMTISMYAKNKHRGGRVKARRIRHLGAYRRMHKNVGAQYVSDMKDVLKIGAVVVVGYAAHRALSKLFDEYAMSKVTQLQTGTAATWRPLISSAIVAAVGVPLTAYLAGKTSAKNLVMPIAAGMAASLLHNALLTALGATGNAQAAKVAGYLSAYPEANARAYNGIGSYYSFKPRQVFGRGATGEFYEVLPQSGFGLDSRQLNQAAAGFGAPVMQAAAGMGAEVTQAAAGTGEYMVYGAEGIGEYEEVQPVAAGAGAYDGILPTLDQAEYALNVAEAAAGLGDLPMQSTVDPTGQASPIAGEPGGSRAGILLGGDGIFGG